MPHARLCSHFGLGWHIGNSSPYTPSRCMCFIMTESVVSAMVENLADSCRRPESSCFSARSRQPLWRTWLSLWCSKNVHCESCYSLSTGNAQQDECRQSPRTLSSHFKVRGPLLCTQFNKYISPHACFIVETCPTGSLTV